jgi:biotin carboxyl carrier protein
MNFRWLRNPILIAVALIVLAAVGYWTRDRWLPQQVSDPIPTRAAPRAKNDPAGKIIVGDQAQKNLGLTAKQLPATIFWKTTTVPGMIVDRPGVSDREIAAPATGTISHLWRVPGDTVYPGDVLFTIKLASETLHQTQADLFKTSENIKLAQSRRERLVSAGEAIARSRIIDIENEIKQLEVTAQTLRAELRHRALSSEDIAGVEVGKLVNELTIVAPAPASVSYSDEALSPQMSSNNGEQPLAFEVQALKVELGEQVQAGQTLCHLSSHKFLAIEGRAFRDETTLLERSLQQGWPVDVDFQEEAAGNWPPSAQVFKIHYLANTIDPVSRTFAFRMPLENQYKSVAHADGTQILWRFRPGQKVLLRVRIEELGNVFVLPADGVSLEGAEAYVFTQNVNTFERKSVHVLYRDHDQVVLDNDGALPTYLKGKESWTIPAIARTAAAQLSRMAKAGATVAPKGYHIHADGSLHKNEDEGKQ